MNPAAPGRGCRTGTDNEAEGPGAARRRIALWRGDMGFQEGMMRFMLGRKSPDDARKMMEEMMPPMRDREQRQAMLSKCRAMLDRMEEEYLKEKGGAPALAMPERNPRHAR